MRYLDPRGVTAIPVTFSLADWLACFEVFNHDLQQCNYDFNEVAGHWMQCAYQGCMSAYEQASSDFQYCYDYVNGLESTILSVEREAGVMRNWGCWDWMDMPIKWNPKLILMGGYRSASFTKCQERLEMQYYSCKLNKEDSNKAYFECGMEVCKAREAAEDYLDFSNECRSALQKNIAMLSGDEGMKAYEQGQKVGCEVCNNDGICDEKETYAECPNDCNICIEDGTCDERTESHENCPNDCICVWDGFCDTAAGENIHTCPGECPNGCNDNGICELDQGEDENTCPQDCGGGGSQPCDNNGICSADETHYYCPTDCPNTWPLWTSAYSTNIQIYNAYGLADFTMCFPNLESCFKGCDPYYDYTQNQCADYITSCMEYVCQSVYGSGRSFEGCMGMAARAKNDVIGNGGYNAYQTARMAGCSPAGITCGGSQCFQGVTSCCTYQGTEVCANSDGTCPQEGDQCGSNYCPLGESCCSGSVCTINGICPDSGGGGSCNNNGICDNGENADFCSSDCGCNYDGTCQSERGETVDTCGNDCGCNSNAICEPGRGEVYGNCEDCSNSGGGGGYNPCSGGWMGMNGCEYPQQGSDCSSRLEGSYWSGTDCACPGSLQNLGNGRCEEGGGSSTQCNSNGICEEGENQEGCSSDCPYGCNNNGKCETANGENEYSCPTDCKSFNSGGSEDYSTSVWISGLNSGLQLQKGYGYNVNWEQCYNNMENCWSYCGYDKNSCIQTNYPDCARSKCHVYGDSILTDCINTAMMIASNLETSDQAQWAFYNAQSKCNSNARRLAQKPHRRLRS